MNDEDFVSFAKRDVIGDISTKAGKKVAAKLGFDPLIITGIISSVLQIFAACKNKTAPDVTPAAYLESHYDASTGEFDSQLVKRARSRTKKAARDKGQKNMSRTQLDAMTVEAFHQVMAEDQEAVSAVCATFAPSDEE